MKSASKYTLVFVTSAVLIQIISGLCLNNLGGQESILQIPINANNLGITTNLGLESSGFSPNLGSSPSFTLSIPAEALSVSSGSLNSANGVSILGDNLEIGGRVGISGAIPFFGTINLNGALPSSGQATVAYNSSPGVGITSGGCGAGLSEPSGASASVISGNNLGAIGQARVTGNGCGY